MPTPFSAFTEISLLIIISAIWLFAGYQITRFLIPGVGKLTLLSLGAVSGEILYLFFINAGSYFFQVKNASLITLGGLLIIGSILFYFNRKKGVPPETGLDKPRIYFLLIVAALIAIFYVIILFFSYEVNFDFMYHQPSASLIAEGNFPPNLPSQPDYTSQYHYGSDLLAGSLISITGIMPWNAFNVIVLWNLFWAFFLANLIGRILSNDNFLAGLLASIVFFFSGGWGYFSIFSAWQPYSSYDFFTYLGLSASYGVHLFHNSTAIAVPTLLLIFLLFYFLLGEAQKNRSLGTLTLLTIIMSALPLFSEEKFSLLAVSLFGLIIYFLLFKKSEKKRTFFYYKILAVIILAAVIVVLQGGVMSNAIFPPPDALSDQSITQFQLRHNPGFVYWLKGYDTGFMPLTDPRWPLFLLQQMGPAPFLFIFILMYLYKKNRDNPQWPLLLLMSIMAVGAFLIPIFVEYPVSDINIGRIFAIFKNISDIFLGITIGLVLTSKSVKSKISKAFILVFLISILFAPLEYNRIIISAQLNGSWGWNALPPNIDSDDLIIAKEAKKIIPKNGRVLTNNLVSIPVLWGRFAPYAENRKRPDLFGKTYVSLFPNPSPENLKSLKIDYIYIAPFKEKVLYGEGGSYFSILKGVDIQYLKSHPRWFTLTKKWEFDNQNYYLFKVLQ